MNLRYMKFIYTSLILVYLSTKAFSQTTNDVTIFNILVDIPDIINKDLYENAYKEMEKKEYNKDNLNFKIKFKISEEPKDKTTKDGYEKYIKSILDNLEDSSIDFLILSDSFLYSDIANIESTTLKDMFSKRQFQRHYLDFKEFLNFNETRLANYEQEIKEDCYFNNYSNIFALPYEIDFDVLYYRKYNNSVTSNIDTNNINWESLLEQIYIKNGEKKSIKMPLKEEEELFDFFTQYINTIKNFKEKKSFEDLYNEADTSIIDKFRDFVTRSECLNLEYKEAYESFLNGESVFFKGKASHFGSLRGKDKAITPMLLPQNKGILHTKYIVINKNSSKDKNELFTAAQTLTDDENQMERYNLYQILPPNFGQLENNDYSDIVNIYSKMEKIKVKEIYKDEKSAPFMEVKYFLPKILKDFLNSKGDIKEIQNVFENIKKILKEKRGIHKLPYYVIYLPAIISTVAAVVIIYLILKYKEHPYLKIYSPNFCVIIIVGMTIGILSLCATFNNDNNKYCKVSYVVDTLSTDLTLFPMVAVTYRIYKILTNTSKENVGINLNRRIIICFVVGLSLMIIYSSCTGFFILDFYLSSDGNITNFRQPSCNYSSDLYILESVERRINEVIYLFLVYMVFRTAKISKRFGEFKYVYIMLFIGILEYARYYLVKIIPQQSYYYSYLAIISCSVLMNGLLIYFLIGSRLYYAIQHSDEIRKKETTQGFETNSYFNTLNNGLDDTTNNDGMHSHFIDISKNSESRMNSFSFNKSYSNKHYNLSSNTTISEFDCCYDSNNNIFNQGFNSYNDFGKNQLSSNTTPRNDYYNSTSALLNQDTYSSQKTVGSQDSQQNCNVINLLKNGSTSNLSNAPNVSFDITNKSSNQLINSSSNNIKSKNQK
ncbi:hypothetical protein BCR36DRAFT_322623 [Piromyces finnis]|uniref:G-protein coupled receptors family 3 profile domain-containing protein n=1 Tax=Piromyces finnis TaxID=1754191 RepID=A0A1Y1VEQ4_9FUNG|nr:hypothetical protein BCR36DRAFT_322623 [Piromyces finnis]|eukprot:ORX54249.1 hypothetical protein BCR36DRAFT_322623 [Piromyces finnis]